MPKALFIVESPTKARTINKMLGRDYAVMASKGHVRDLPEHEFGVDVEHGFAPRYVVIEDHKKVVAELAKAAAGAKTVYLAPDPDREGEAIAWHLKEMLAPKTKADFKRVTYHEITATAIRRALENPGDIDMPRVDAQQARRILDRLVGYKISPTLRRRVPGAASAGRVQSVALRLICERERAIQDFKPEAFWTFAVNAAKQVPPKTPFLARLAKIDGQKADVRNEADARRIDAELKSSSLRVADLLQKDLAKSPQPPFITSTLQQAAASQLGFYSKNTMRLAQKLYEGVDLGSGSVGLITYMRTDSFNIAAEARAKAAEVIARTFGPEYVPDRPNVFKSRSSAQEAHEAIRPTDPARTPDSLRQFLDKDAWRLYDLIWRRFMASQMAKARIHQRTAEIEAVPAAAPTSYLFRATASEVTFPGFMAALGYEPKKPENPDEESDEVAALPPLDKGEPLSALEWLCNRKETQPPPRYTEASLIKTLEENGVGRPSTYAQIISVIIDRNYVERSKKNLVPTDLGLKAKDFLVAHLDALFNVKFTAEMETELDQIEEGKLSWTDMLAAFNGHFREWLGNLRGPDANSESVAALLKAFDAVKTWRPERTSGKRTYSDEKFVRSVREQFEKNERPISQRQLDALGKLLLAYKDQCPDAESVLKSLSMPTEPPPQSVVRGPELPLETSKEKLALFDGVAFRPPRKIGRRVYDDAKFVASLREQVAGGRGLSAAQDAAVSKVLLQYADEIKDFAARTAHLGLAAEAPAAPSAEVEGLLAAFANHQNWKPPATRRGRVWDDKAFVESIRRQYQEKKALSPRQIAALKRMAASYKLV